MRERLGHKLSRWANAVLVIPRWLLSVKYALFFVLGVVATLAGAPTLDSVIGFVYGFAWSVLLAMAAVVAFVASLEERWESVEKWAAVAIVGFLSAYVLGNLTLLSGGDLSRAVFSVMLVILTLLPGARAAALIVASRR